LPLRDARGLPLKGLKPHAFRSDLEGVATVELNCPVCSADVPIAGDEKAGDEVFCTYCGAPCRLTAAPSSEDCELEEDY
jgi:hypothetical protein